MKSINYGFCILLLIAACSPKTGEILTTSASEIGINDTPIEASLDLIKLVNDRVLVTIDPGSIEGDSILFRLPRVVQGTYEVSNFGSFVEEFTAFNYEGVEIDVVQVDENSWLIDNTTGFDSLEYYVNDTFDIETSSTPTPFSPSGTNIEPDIFVLNLHGFIGYFEGKEDLDYNINVKSDASLSGSSAIPMVDQVFSADSTIRTDIYFANRYFDVTDNPMMYGNLEIEDFMVEDIQIVLSVYSPTMAHSAADIKETVVEMMRAQKEYLGDLNSTTRYDIFLHLSTSGPNQAQGYGALEHHTSTVVVLPEWLDKAQLDEAMIDVVSHEFFHIVTPLSVHSEDVHYFDYNSPSFSKHLWMYEGITEYFASHFQVYEDLQSRHDFFQKLEDKISYSLTLDDAMSFTEMSENVLEEPYASNYLNVYMKGALIGMCLDIIMREESNGERSMLSLMKELSAKYGTDQPFMDDNIIGEITSMTYPSIGEFLQTHVVGSVPINYDFYFEKVGLTAEDVEEPSSFFFHETELQNAQTPFIDADPGTGEVFFADGELNSTLTELGVQNGDIIKEVNGIEVTLQTVNSSGLIPMSFEWSPTTEISMVLNRNGEEIEVNGVVGEPTMVQTKLRQIINATPEQVQLLNYWLEK